MTHTKKELELAERGLFTRFNNQYGFFSHIEFSPIGSYEKYDVKGVCKGRQVIADIKVRDRVYPTMLIEKIKYDYLMSRPEIPVYINIICNQVYMIDLMKVKIDWVEQSHWVDSSKKNKKKKLVGFIPTSFFRLYMF